MTNDTMTITYLENEPLTPKGKELTDVLSGLNRNERIDAVLDLLAHDQTLLDAVRVRMNWEMRNAVVQGMKEYNSHPNRKEMEQVYGGILSEEVDEIMPILFGELYEEHNEEIDEVYEI